MANALLDPSAVVTSGYQDRFNRPPSQADLSYWAGQISGGMSPFTFDRHLMDSTEGQVNASYMDMLGRPPDQAGFAHYNAMYPQMGHMGVRRDIQRQEEFQNRLLGGAPETVSQGMGRQAAAGINAMPGVFSDFTYPSMGSDLGRQAIYPGTGQGAQMMPSILDMLTGAFAPEQKKTEAPKELASLFQELLKRDPEEAAIKGYEGWTPEAIRKSILSSPEYRGMQKGGDWRGYDREYVR